MIYEDFPLMFNALIERYPGVGDLLVGSDKSIELLNGLRHDLGLYPISGASNVDTTFSEIENKLKEVYLER